MRSTSVPTSSAQRLRCLRGVRSFLAIPDRLAERRGLFLNAAGVGEDQRRRVHRLHELRIFERRALSHVDNVAEKPLDRLPQHLRIDVQRPKKLECECFSAKRRTAVQTSAMPAPNDSRRWAVMSTQGDFAPAASRRCLAAVQRSASITVLPVTRMVSGLIPSASVACRAARSVGAQCNAATKRDFAAIELFGKRGI